MEYFILKDNEHLGPYGADVIVRFLKQGKIGKSQLLWREGLKAPKRFDDLFKPVSKNNKKAQVPTVANKMAGESTDSTSTLIELPPLPSELKPKAHIVPREVKTPPSRNQKRNIIHADIQSSSKLKAKLYKYLKEIPTLMGELSHSFDISFIKDFRLTKKKLLISGIPLSVIILLYNVFLAIPNEVQLIRPAQMGINDFNRLEKIANLPLKTTQLGYILSKDKKILWIGTNLKGDGEVTAKFKSIKNRSLGQAVEFYATGQLNNHIVELKNFKFNKGARLVDALYEIEVKSSKALTLSFWDKLNGENSVVMNYSGKGLVSSYNATQFKALLGKMIQQKRKNTKEFWLEIGEKYKTVQMITGQIRAGVEAIFTTPKEQWEGAILNFENQYRQSWGQFFTAFVKANDKSYAMYAKKKFEDKSEVLAYYNNLSNLAIQIGENSMQVLETLQSLDLKIVTTQTWEEIRDKAIEQFKLIESQCEEQMKNIEKVTE